MRLHFIAASILITTLLCGCSANAPSQPPTSTTDAKAKAERQKEDSIADVLPDEDVQSLLFKRVERGYAEEKADDAHAKQEEDHLRKLAERAASAKDVESEAAIVLEMGDFYRHEKRIHDALRQYKTAAELGERMKDNNGMRAHALAQMGEMNMRLFKYKDAIANFDEAIKLVKEPNRYLESTAKMELRKAWALHRDGRDEEAKALLAKAKEQALKQGKQSSAYHVAIAEEGGLALEAKDSATAAKKTEEFDALPETTMPDAEFGQNCLKACAKSSRHEGHVDVEDYFEDRGNYFRSIIKQIRRSARRAQIQRSS